MEDHMSLYIVKMVISGEHVLEIEQRREKHDKYPTVPSPTSHGKW